MTTTKLSFSPARAFGCYREVLRRNRGSGAFFGALVFIFLPLQYLLSLLDARSIQSASGTLTYFLNNMVGPASCYNGVAAIFFTSIALLGAIILPTSLFGYLHNRRAVDVYHSLPYTREELLVAHCGAGITLLYLPIILSFLMMAGMSFLLPGLSAVAILVELLCWLAIVFAVFMITVFAAVQVGSLFDTAVFSLVLNGSLSAIWLMGIALSSSFLYGYNPSDEAMMTAYKLSPVSLIIGRIVGSSAMDTDFTREMNIAIFLWLLGGLLLFAGAVILYRRRKSEQAEVLGTLGPLSLYVRAIGTLLAGVGLGTIFISVFNLGNKEFWVLSIIFLSSILSYFVGDVILARSVRRVRNALPAAVVMAALVTGFVATILLDLTGFETRVPKAAEVQSVVVIHYEGRYGDQSDFRESGMNFLELSSPEAVALILEAHRQQVESYKQDEGTSQNTSTRFYGLTLRYKTNTGEVNRRYYSPYHSTQEPLLQLEANSEFIQKTHPIFRATAEDIRTVEVYSALSDVNQEFTPDAAQRNALLAAVQADLMAQTAEELRGTKMVARLLIELPYEPFTADAHRLNGNRVDYDPIKEGWTERSTYVKVLVTPSWTQTIAFLNANGMRFILEDQKARIDTAYIGISEKYRNNSVVAQYSAEQRSRLESELNSVASAEQAGFLQLTPAQLDTYYPHMTNLVSSSEPMVTVVVTSRPESGTGTLDHGQDLAQENDSLYKEETTAGLSIEIKTEVGATKASTDPASMDPALKVVATGVYYLPLSAIDPALVEKLVLSTYATNDQWLLYENNIEIQIPEDKIRQYDYGTPMELIDQLTVVRKDGRFILTTKEAASNLQG